MFNLFKRNPYKVPAARLYDQLVAHARHPAFYTAYGVPDTLDGRFECITLHVFAAMFRLRNETVDPANAEKMAQALFDAMFRDMDRSLREMGVGDLSVPKKMKVMMKSFNGRCYTYTAALAPAAPATAFADALRRNLYGTVPDIADAKLASMLTYTGQMLKQLMNVSFADVTALPNALPNPVEFCEIEVNDEKAA